MKADDQARTSVNFLPLPAGYKAGLEMLEDTPNLYSVGAQSTATLAVRNLGPGTIGGPGEPGCVSAGSGELGAGD